MYSNRQLRRRESAGGDMVAIDHGRFVDGRNRK
jgi:hypothetical protein